MAFWEIFTQKTETDNTNSSINTLHDKISSLLPESNEDELIKVACISGLLARVAYVDFNLDPGEKEEMINLLKKWTKFHDNLINSITEIATSEIKELAGLENHKYCHPLNDIMNESERYDILVSLFAIAASDGSVEVIESEEIRVISTGLRLTNKHYIAARATVLEKLKVLK